MKRILITGADSYIGGCINKWLSRYDGEYSVEEVDMIDGSWKDKDFSPYDVVVHVAGIVHIKENPSLEELYDKVNARLPVEVAKKAKAEGVGHFIFFSTKGVYTPNTPFIDKDTETVPTKFYGKSKLKAEKALAPLESDDFHISILRPPTVYGEGCKGNFPSLENFSKKHHIFPRKYNQRSMIYIWNLCEFVRRIIDEPLVNEKILFPQNKEFKGTLDILKGLWDVRGEKYYLSFILAATVTVAMLLPKTGKLKAMFKNTVYSAEISDYFDNEYCVYSFDESIKRIVESEQEA